MKKILKILTLIILFAVSAGLFMVANVSADTVDELKSKIAEKGGEIEELEKEIDKYTREIVEVQAESKTLSSSIKSLDLTRKKLLTDIDVTNKEIESTNYSLQKIKTEIDITINKIKGGNDVIGNIMRNVDELETKSLVEVILENDELSDFWNDIENMERFRDVISENLRELEDLKIDLQVKKIEKEDEKRSLLGFEFQLQDQKQVVEINKENKSHLLEQTENKEANYQKMLADKKAAKEAFEKELADFESQLKMVIDQSRLPALGSGVLGWPLKDLSLNSCYDGSTDATNCVTQYFGNTAFARSGAYDGKGHNGVDFRAAVGEPLYASADGTILGTGNTDLQAGCYSYGQWVVITHDNGLATLYAHMSLIKVQKGQYVHKGDMIGYSGNTGYSTGPHLHYSVYASEGVSIVRMGDIKKVTNCSDVNIPVAPFNAYLNPMDYLSSTE